MNHAKKMLLIDPDTLGRLQQHAKNPVNNTISSLDQEMSRILKLKQLTDDEKWLQYKQVLTRFLHFTSELRNPISLPIISDTEREEEVKTEVNHIKNEEGANALDIIKIQTLKSVPLRSKNIAELLYDSLNNAEIIKWDKAGSVSVQGVKIQGSSIIDLISDVVRNRQDSSPVGWVNFANVLAELNIPREYIVNARRKEFIQQLQSKQHTPTTSSPKSRSVQKNKKHRYQPWQGFKF